MSDPIKYEYLDHTADIQLHSWGATLGEAIGNCVVAMYGYMTADISSVEPAYTMDFQAEGEDLCSLVYNLLDACLYRFSTEPFFIGMRCEVISLEKRKCKEEEGDDTKFAGAQDEEGFEEFQEFDGVDSDPRYKIHLRVWGESFDKDKHPPGTEVKAITYSNLQVLEPRTDSTAPQEEVDACRRGEADEDGNIFYAKHDDQFNIFVIVDI